MKKRTSLSKVFEFAFGPWMILPQAFLILFIFPAGIYVHPELSKDYEKFIFFQGNIDMGGASIFAGTVFLYVYFGFTASWYLLIRLNSIQHVTYLESLRYSLGVLKYHILAFLIGGTVNIGYDSYAGSNDFRNMFIFAFLLYGLSILFICFLNNYKLKEIYKIFLAPLFIFIWLFIGSDGNTERAGQLVSHDKNYVYKVRGLRHNIMVSWHKLCDSILGDIK